MEWKEKEAQVWLAVLEADTGTKSAQVDVVVVCPFHPSTEQHTAQSYCAKDSQPHMFQNPATNPHLSLTRGSVQTHQCYNCYTARSFLSTSICRSTVFKLGPPIAARRSMLASKSKTLVTSASNFGESFCSCSNVRSDIWT